MMSELKISLNRSEIVLINNGDDDTMQICAGNFNCQIGTFPMKFLGSPEPRQTTNF